MKGTRLDEVEKAELGGILWTPTTLSRVQDFDELRMTTTNSTTTLEPGKRSNASVQLRDGRQQKVPVTVDPPRPQVALLSKGVQEDTTSAVSPVHLGNPNDLPIEGRLVFFLKSNIPAAFPRSEKVEMAAGDGSVRSVLTLADGSLMLEDAKTALGVVDPLIRFGSSAFGPVQVRAVSADGVTGDWIPLGTLVRLPGFKELHCPHTANKPCTLSGTNLFLLASVAATPDFDNALDVPLDFTGTQLSVPHTSNGVFYLRLRDDPASIQALTLPVLPSAPQAQSASTPPPATAPAQPTKTEP